MSDDRLIVALDVPNIIAGMDLVNKLGKTVSFYKIYVIFQPLSFKQDFIIK